MHPAPHPADWARLERALKRQEIAEEAAHVGTFEADLATGELTISREVARLHHWDPALLTLSGQEFLRSVHPVDRDRIMGLAGSREDFTVDYRFLCPDGISTRIFEISGRWLAADAETDHPRHPGYFVGVERDVTEQRAQEAQLRRLALHDSLTGALNRRGFEDLLTRYAAEHAVPESGSLLMIDLDHFKHHNDTYGHAVGDALLVAIASAVQEHLGPEEAIG
ncbi:MAG: diguanylate cyclase domain-containing protein, partial [Nocardioides sp.]